MSALELDARIQQLVDQEKEVFPEFAPCKVLGRCKIYMSAELKAIIAPAVDEVFIDNLCMPIVVCDPLFVGTQKPSIWIGNFEEPQEIGYNRNRCGRSRNLPGRPHRIILEGCP